MKALSLDLARRFRDGPTVEAKLSLSLEAPEVLVLFGPSGAGKTTVLRCLAGLDRPDEGRITFGDETWCDVARGVHLAPQARRVGLLFQDDALFPHLSVEENVGYGLFAEAAAARAQRVRELLARFDLGGLEQRRPRELSGGQRQRVALARALAPRPRLLLLDEPLSALDAPTRTRLRGELRTLLKAAGVPAVVVTHDRHEALALGDTLAVLTEGKVRQVGPMESVFSAPADLAVAQVVGTENIVPATVVERADGLVALAVGAARLWAVDPGPATPGAGAPEAVWACVRAEEVVLEPAATAASARNQLAGTVTAVQPEGALARVTVDCGFTLHALVTRRSVEQLALAPGHAVVAMIKAPAVRAIPRGGA